MLDQRRPVGGRAREVTEDAATSKIGVPVLPDWVIPRPQLVARIGKGSRGPLTVVTGAPGAGKTVAVASWVASLDSAEATATAPGPVAWVTVDDGDGDPEVFWRYLLGALRHAGLDLPFTDRSPFRADGIDHVYIAELASALKGSALKGSALRHRDSAVVLVLDDFRPTVGSQLVAGMAYLLKLARPALRLMITSRRDLPLPLHRYRLTGDLTEIRADDLAFSQRETDLLMAQHGVVLRRESVRALRERTEGWAAGLRLAAMSMDGHPDPDEFVAQIIAGDHAIAGYLVEEVLDAQQPTVRRMLLTTSILDRVNAEIATELTQGTVGTEFSEVVGQNAFIRPVGHGWYRYHQMFRDVLRLRLRHENPGEVTVLHLRAAAWFSSRGLLAEAVAHAAAVHAWQLACALVVDRLAMGELLGLRPASRLDTTLRQLPEHVGLTSLEPALVVAALALGRGDGASCRSALRRVADLLAQMPEDDAAPARLTAALLRLVHARVQQEADVAGAAGEVEKLFRGLAPELIDGRPDVRCLAVAGRAVTELWAGQWTQAAESLAAAHAAASEADSGLLRLDCLAHGALVEVLRGRWGRAAELAIHAAQLVSAQTSPICWRIIALPVVRAWIALERYQLVDARRELGQAGHAELERSQPLMAAVRGLVSALIDVADGQHDRALDTLRRIGTTSSMPAWLAGRLLLAEAEAAAAAGAPVAAWQAAIHAAGGHPADGAVALARIQLCTGQPTEALGTLHPALTDAVTIRSDVRVEAWLLDAQASYVTGNPTRGRRSLDRALRLGDREQVRLPFAARSAWLRSVLRSDQELARHYLRLLEPLRIGAAQSGGMFDQDLVPSRHLSDRELEVLQHLAQMRTSEEIATEMYLSINTVKTHLKSIYRKLAVTRRGDAVRRAHQLELLVSPGVPTQRSQQPQSTGSPDGLHSG
ncbi:MAG: LuxR C-terminal-related transcriptional regulator [Pseudonocardiaceae bacterium]